MGGLLSSMTIEYKVDFSSVTSGVSRMKQELASVTPAAQSSSGGLLSGFKSAAGGLLDFGSKVGMTVMGIKGLADTAIGLGSALLGPAMNAESLGTAFVTLTGSTQKATAMIKELNHFADITPFEPDQVQQYAAQLIGMGINGKQVIPIMTSLGDALFGVGHGTAAEMGSVVDIFGKINVAGKLTGEDISQLSEHGIAAGQLLSQAFHKPVSAIMDMASKGLIPANLGIKALTEGIENNPLYKGGMAKQANSLSGILSTLSGYAKTAVNSFLGLKDGQVVAGSLFDTLKKGVNTLATWLQNPAIQQFATNLGQQIGQVIGIIGPMIGDVGHAFQSLQPILSNVGAFFQDFFNRVLNDEPIGLLIGAFANVGVTIGNLIGPVLQLAGAFLKVFGIDFTRPKSAVDGIISSISTFSSIMQSVANTSGIVATKIGQFVTWLDKGGIAADTFKAVLIGLGVAFAAIQIGSLIATIPALVTGFVAWATAAGAAAIATIAAALPIILIGAAIALVVAGIVLAVTHWGEISKWLQVQWTTFSAWFMGAMGAVGAFFTGLWTGMQAGLQTAWAFIVNVVRVGAQLLYQAILGPFIAIGQLFVWLYQHNTYFQRLVDAIVSIVSAGVAWLQNAWSVSVNFVAAQWQRLIGFASSIWNSVAAAVRSAVAVAVSFLQAQWNTASAWIQAQWSRIAGFAQTAWAAVSRVFSGIWGTYIAGPMGNLWNQFVNWFNNMKNQFLQSGQNFINMLVQGIQSGAGSIWNAVVGIANTIWKALGFHSPAKEGPASDADRWMPNLVDMLSTSLVAGIPKMQSAAIATAQPLRAFAPSSAAATSAVVAAAGSNAGGSGGSGGEQHIYVELDGQQLTHTVMKHTDRIVRLKLGAKGRIA